MAAFSRWNSRNLVASASWRTSIGRSVVGTGLVWPVSLVTTNFITSGITPTPASPGKGAEALLVSFISVPAA